MVVLICVCPNNSLTVTRSAPFMTRWLAKVCLNVCGVALLLASTTQFFVLGFRLRFAPVVQGFCVSDQGIVPFGLWFGWSEFDGSVMIGQKGKDEAAPTDSGLSDSY